MNELTETFGSLWKWNGRWGGQPGSHIDAAMSDAVKLAVRECAPVSFVFNEVTVIVAPDSDVGLLLRDWHRAQSRYVEGPVGPYPERELSPEETSAGTQQTSASRASCTAAR